MALMKSYNIITDYKDQVQRKIYYITYHTNHKYIFNIKIRMSLFYNLKKYNKNDWKSKGVYQLKWYFNCCQQACWTTTAVWSDKFSIII